MLKVEGKIDFNDFVKFIGKPWTIIITFLILIGTGYFIYDPSKSGRNIEASDQKENSGLDNRDNEYDSTIIENQDKSTYDEFENKIDVEDDSTTEVVTNRDNREDSAVELDTLKVLLPSRFMLKRVKIDNDIATLINQNLSSVVVSVPSREGNRSIEIMSNNDSCRILSSISNQQTISFTRVDCEY